MNRRKYIQSVATAGMLATAGCLGGGGDLYVVVDYSGSWSGAVGSVDSTRTVSGSGRTEIDVDDGADIVSANAQKRSGGGTLTIKIKRGSETLKEESTSAQYGVAQVSANV